jgi:acid phosphatase class B
LSFRISMGMAFLIGETRSEIDDLRKQCADIYNLRSKLVHGSIDVNDRRIVEAADYASDLAMRAMKVIYRDAPDLIAAKSTERTLRAVLRNTKSSENDDAPDS